MTDMPDRKAAYFSEAQSWARDRNDALVRSRRVAWIVAAIAVVVVVIEAIALLVLMPLKTVVPYTLLVDRQTGYVQALDPLAANRIAPDTALTQSFLVQYVIARESFDRATIQSDYRKVALWSADTAASQYTLAMQATNPDSPLVRLPRDTLIETRIRSVSPLSARSALVRFETVRHDRGGLAQAPQGWVAIVTYRFSDKPMTVEDRFVNPLGFQVERYRRNPETAPLAEPTPVPAQSPPAGVAAIPQNAPPVGVANPAERLAPQKPGAR